MNTEAQRIAIAEACGWKGPFSREWLLGRGSEGDREWADPAGTSPEGERDHLPDYLNSIDAMHEAEKVLALAQRISYRASLATIFARDEGQGHGGWAWVHATAAQRAEAFLQTLNLWKE